MLRSDGIRLDSTNNIDTTTVDQGSVFYDTTQQSVSFASDGTRIPVNYLQRRLHNVLSTGVLEGGNLSLIDSTTFALGSGIGIITDNYSDTFRPSSKIVGWDDFTSTSPYINSEAVSYIRVTSDASVEITADEPDRFDHRDYLIIGFLNHPGPIISDAVNKTHAAYDPGLNSQDFYESFGIFNVSGNVYGPDGTSSLMSMSKGSGKTYGVGINYIENKKVPNLKIDGTIAPVNFLYNYLDGTTWTPLSSEQTVIDASTYNSGVPGGGDLTSVPDGSWTIQPIWYYSYTEDTIMQYGQDIYPSKDDARANLTSPFESTPAIQSFAFRGWLLVRGDATDLSNEDQALFVTASDFGTPSINTSAGSGEINTGSNIGLEGVGPFYDKAGVVLEFRNIAAGSNRVTVTDDTPNKTIDVDVDPNEINLADLGNVDATGPSDGQVLAWDSTSSSWVGASNKSLETILFEDEGIISSVNSYIGTGWAAPRPGIITGVRLFRRFAGNDGTTTVDINNNGTTVFSTQSNRPSVTSGDGNNAVTSSGTINVNTFSEGDWLEAQIDSRESGLPRDLGVTVEVFYD